MSGGQRQIRVAVIGAGAIAQVAHLPILTRMRGVEVAALYDAEHAKARTIADRFQVPYVARSADEIWNDDEVQAVVICTPNHLHEEQVSSSIQAGKFVLCEKPLALDASGALRILAHDGAAERLVVGMNQRFRPDAIALKSFVSGGELGEIFYSRAGWLVRRAVPPNQSWRQQKRVAGGGALMDLGLQMLDLSLWLTDYPEPERVSAHIHGVGGDEVEDSAVLLIHLKGNHVLHLEVTWAFRSNRERQYLHLLGSSGSGSLGPLEIFKEMDSGLTEVTPQLAPGLENQYMASYRQQLSSFLELVRGERENEPPRDQVVLLRIAEAAYRSAREGSEVRF